MTLRELLSTPELKGYNVKIHCVGGTNHVYAYKNDLEFMSNKKSVVKFLDREVVEYFAGQLPEEQPCMIINIKGNEIGKFWLISEYKRYLAKGGN